MKKMRRRIKLGIYSLNFCSKSTLGIEVEVMDHFRVLQSGNIDVSEAVGNDVHIHVLLETISGDDILKWSYAK